MMYSLCLPILEVHTREIEYGIDDELWVDDEFAVDDESRIEDGMGIHVGNQPCIIH